MNNLLIFGVSDAAELAHFYFQREKKFKIAGFVVDADFKGNSLFKNLPVYDLESVAKKLPSSEYSAFVAVGYSGLNDLRRTKYEWFKRGGYSMATYISPHAICQTEVIGDNCFIQEGCVVQPFVRIGDNVTVWSGAHIAHHSIIEDHCFIAPRAAISGRVTIREMSFVGINATIKDHVVVGRRSVIGAGALIVDNTDEGTLLKSMKAQSSPLTSDSIKKI